MLISIFWQGAFFGKFHSESLRLTFSFVPICLSLFSLYYGMGYFVNLKVERILGYSAISDATLLPHG